jgi:hypothetical protein
MGQEVTFTAEEMAALKIVFSDWARMQGEDTIGVLMKAGAFRPLPSGGVARLARKIDGDSFVEPTGRVNVEGKVQRKISPEEFAKAIGGELIPKEEV